ncbi:hypothetical protein BSZ39_04370 [Bowdeniella nasicola]|uniref:Uncharacterized protein n=1 Tax=Bowdeniella nasicola TaxID=208480 RepID=A0A1Q5Q3M4_9ACTO|nr:hypothetical protein [Bowdeniella nasicola]OKL54397.1 hypothetical protein BSZ39_04370 [Bowdeniella nasicola]
MLHDIIVDQGVLVHSNQASGWWTVNDLQEYSAKAKPDLLTFDYYYSRNKWRWKSPNETWNKIGRTSEPHAQTYHLLSGADKFQQWQRHREAALEGPDGTGKTPMVFGQHLGSFDYNAAESQKAYLVNLSLASGMKWLSFFRFEHAFDGTFLWDAGLTLTRRHG